MVSGFSPGPMPAANQQAIADRLDLSRATVSRCFTNHAGISPITRAKVFQVAAEIGYVHMESRSASPKKAQQNHGFSVLICTDRDEYLEGYESPGEQILAGVSEYGQVHDVRVDVNFIPPDAESCKHPVFDDIDGLKERANRGVLLIYPFPAKVIEELALRFPLVSLVEQLGNASIDCVDVDHSSGISSVVNHLVAAGHERIGFYTREYPHQASWSFRRYGAFIEKMARLQMEVRPADIVGMFPRHTMNVAQSIKQVAERTDDGVTAWVCAADHQAYDLIDGLTKAGMEVPGQVSVTGFDGITPSGSNPALTTIQVPYRAIGMTGAERLAARMRKRFSDRQHVSISGELRSGKTVGQAGKRG